MPTPATIVQMNYSESEPDDHCHPVVNVEETIGKTVGRRVPRRGLSLEGSRKVDKERWREAVGGVGVPRGVYRYRTHEEADKWLIQETAKRAAKKS